VPRALCGGVVALLALQGLVCLVSWPPLPGHGGPPVRVATGSRPAPPAAPPLPLPPLSLSSKGYTAEERAQDSYSAQARIDIARLSQRVEQQVAVGKLLRSRGETPLSAPSACARSMPTRTGPGIFRFATWNLWNVQHDWPNRCRGIAEWLRHLGPEIVGVQEVRHYPSPNGKPQLEELARQAGFPYFYYHPAGFPGRTDEEGVGVLSQLPLGDVKSFTIPLSRRSSDRNARVCLRVTVNTSTTAGPVDFFVTHLSYDAAEQCRQVVALRSFLDESAMERPHRPQILVGDLNIYRDFEWPMDYLQALETKSYLALHGVEDPCSRHRDPPAGPPMTDGAHPGVVNNVGTFEDVWLAGNDPTRRGSDLNSGWTFPNLPGAENAPARCDRMLLRSSGHTVLRAALVGCPSSDTSASSLRAGATQYRIADGREGGPGASISWHGAPSDHRAVVADVQFKLVT